LADLEARREFAWEESAEAPYEASRGLGWPEFPDAPRVIIRGFSAGEGEGEEEEGLAEETSPRRRRFGYDERIAAVGILLPIVQQTERSAMRLLKLVRTKVSRLPARVGVACQRGSATRYT